MRLPKELAGIKFNELFFIELNDFDVDMLLPAFFWMIRSGGKQRVESKERDPLLLQSKLATHTNMIGFETSNGQRVLGKWLKTAVYQSRRAGRGRNAKVEVSYVKPLSYLVFKGPGPSGGSLRQTHLFLYDLLSRHCRSQGNERAFLDLVRDAFAKGLVITDGMVKDGRYDGKTKVDVEVLLSMYFLDGLSGVKETVTRTGKPSEPVCPNASRILAEDVLLFLITYRNQLSPTAMANHLASLLNFEFLLYTLNLCRGTNNLVKGADSPELSRQETPSRLDLYVDITQDRIGRSAALAQLCMNRDLEEAEAFLQSSLLLKTTAQLVAEHPDLQKELTALSGCDRLRMLSDFRKNPDIESDARALLRKLRSSLSEQVDEGDELPEEVSSCLDQGSTALDRATNTLYFFQRRDAVGKVIKWIQSTGGLRRGDGIIEGNLRGRRVWRYSLSDQLLEVLCMIAAANPEVQEASGTSSRVGFGPRPILLSAFLDFLKRRYGILIAEPPAFEQGTETIAAAKDNLSALRRRLRQLGLFQDLSDDFNAQRIEPRYSRRDTKT